MTRRARLNRRMFREYEPKEGARVLLRNRAGVDRAFIGFLDALKEGDPEAFRYAHERVLDDLTDETERPSDADMPRGLRQRVDAIAPTLLREYRRYDKMRDRVIRNRALSRGLGRRRV